jgi:hypothetical protein
MFAEGSFTLLVLTVASICIEEPSRLPYLGIANKEDLVKSADQ